MLWILWDARREIIVDESNWEKREKRRSFGLLSSKTTNPKQHQSSKVSKDHPAVKSMQVNQGGIRCKDRWKSNSVAPLLENTDCPSIILQADALYGIGYLASMSGSWQRKLVYHHAFQPGCYILGLSLDKLVMSMEHISRCNICIEENYASNAGRTSDSQMWVVNGDIVWGWGLSPFKSCNEQGYRVLNDRVHHSVKSMKGKIVRYLNESWVVFE